MSDPAERLLAGGPPIGRTDALLVVRSGEIQIERYGPGVEPSTTLRSWSMAKSVLHAVVGILVADGALDLEAPAPVPEWHAPGDPRAAITLRHLMTMRSGLRWVEAPTDEHPGLPDSVLLVYGHDRGPQPDTAAWAADRPLDHRPGAHLSYSSGSSAIVARLVRDCIGSGPEGRAWIEDRLFAPLGMASPKLRFDASGTWLASSFCFATARDFARFGQLYLDGGTVGDRQLLDPAWVATAREETGRDEEGQVHTMHWWRWGDDPWGAFHASGYLGQHVVVVPPLDLVVVRLGETPTGERHHLHRAIDDLIASFAR